MSQRWEGRTKFYEFIRTRQLFEIAEKKVHCIHDTDTVYTALQMLLKHKILSLPVLDEDNNPYGSIDVLDLITYATHKLDPTRVPNLNDQKSREFLEREVYGLLDLSDRNAWHSIPSRKSLKKALPFLSHPKIHRIWLTDMPDAEPVGVLTQSRLVEYLLENKSEFPDDIRWNLKVQELWPESQQVRGSLATESVIEAFKKLFTDRVSGLAILDKDGALVGNISASDIKYTKFEDPKELLNNLKGSIEEFFKTAERPINKPIVVTSEDTLEKVMEVAHKNKVHRVYCVDDNDRPIKVISLSDMIGQFWL